VGDVAWSTPDGYRWRSLPPINRGLSPIIPYYAGDTYVVQDLSAVATFATTDIVVKITGLVDLSGLAVTDFNFA
jgi:hypothetical protein